MPPEPTSDHLPGRLMRRFAEQLASRGSCERVLYPLLADLQFEYTRTPSRWGRAFVHARGVLVFWRAFGLTSVIDAGHHLWANAWATGAEEARATKRLLGRFAAATSAFALTLTAVYWYRTPRFFASLFALSLASVLLEALLLGVLFAFVLSADRNSIRTHWRGFRSVAVLAALATFVVAAWLTPAANRAYRARGWRLIERQIVPGQFAPSQIVTAPVRGDREMTLDELSARSAELRAHGWNDAAARFDVEWHKKPALAALCLALALAGAAIGSTARRGLVRFFAGLVVSWSAWALLRVGEEAADNGQLLPALAMWGPAVLVGIAALAALRSLTRYAVGASPSA